ncbi:hypothetical protein EVAR_20536_1 [Eumeta japonica]|uniref:Zinc finger BED domain-containing protein 4 n=1 Tax=Eumeta variegata TaxID=151549 RepID=A0A4C1VJM6_EUMVA|nr:hypothetical protein EVAR_20536_1 [Eumeta japonica]
MVQRFLELRSVINNIPFRYVKAPNAHWFRNIYCLIRYLDITTFGGSHKRNFGRRAVAKEVQKLALQEMTKRMGLIEYVTALAIATILDPRFKKMHFNDAIACSNAVSKIKDLMKINWHQNVNIESDSDKSD